MLQNSTFNDALLPFVFLVFVLLVWSFIILFTKTFGVLLFLPGTACCTIRALLKALIIFFLVVIKLCLQRTTEFSVWTHRSPCNFLLLLSLGTVSLTFQGSDQFFISKGTLFLTLLFFLLIFKCVLRGKKWQFFQFPTIVGSCVTATGSLNSGVKLNFWWLCRLLCLGLDYFPLFSGDSGIYLWSRTPNKGVWGTGRFTPPPFILNELLLPSWNWF